MNGNDPWGRATGRASLLLALCLGACAPDVKIEGSAEMPSAVVYSTSAST